MNATRDPETILAAWLDEGPTDLPDATRRAILIALPITPQTRRRVFAPWRFPQMNTTTRVAATALVAVLAAGGALYLIGPGSGADGPASSPTATPAVTPSATPVPTARALSTRTFKFPVSMTVPYEWNMMFDAPDSYTAFRAEVDDPLAPVIGIDLTTAPNAFVNPCAPTPTLADPPIGPSVEALVAWFQAAPGLTASEPDPATVGGAAGLAVDVTFVATDACPTLNLWPMPNGVSSGTVYYQLAGFHQRYYVLNVAGERVIVVLYATEAAWDGGLPELEAVLGTVEFR